jgi:hypothetical protein
MTTSNFWEGGCGCHRSTRTVARGLQAEFSERSRLRKTATKPAEFSGPNRSTQSYCINIYYYLLIYNINILNNNTYILKQKLRPKI